MAGKLMNDPPAERAESALVAEAASGLERCLKEGAHFTNTEPNRGLVQPEKFWISVVGPDLGSHFHGLVNELRWMVHNIADGCLHNADIRRLRICLGCRYPCRNNEYEGTELHRKSIYPVVSKLSLTRLRPHRRPNLGLKGPNDGPCTCSR